MAQQNSLASFLKDARNKAALSQKDVADHMGYDTPQFISNWERGISAPPVNAIKKLAQLYKISADSLFETLLEEEIRITSENLRRKFKSARA
ncbi:MAG TPA: helix-turn-helix transcriptional regulator [Bdellovibrio sp.]|uniref:helix-turn-helix domain-containing protein n=1 Tax=Bdellovibrio sp. TaxID=28201 RepID=UPI002F076108